MSTLYDSVLMLIADRACTKEAEARRLWEITRAECRARLLRKVGQLMAEVAPLHAYDLSQVIFDPTCDTWRLEVSGFEFTQIMTNPNITAMLVPPICTQGCAERIFTTNDLILLVARHLSFPDHAEAPRQHAA